MTYINKENPSWSSMTFKEVQEELEQKPIAELQNVSSSPVVKEKIANFLKDCDETWIQKHADLSLKAMRLLPANSDQPERVIQAIAKSGAFSYLSPPILAETLGSLIQQKKFDLAENIIKQMLNQGNFSLSDITFPNGATLLHKACLTGDLSFIDFLVEKGAEVNRRDEHQLTPLHVACQIKRAGYDNLEIIKKLLILGADPTLQDVDGRTPLHWSLENGQEGVAKYLVEKGGRGQVFIADKEGMTPLHIAARWEHPFVLDLCKFYKNKSLPLNNKREAAVDIAYDKALKEGDKDFKLAEAMLKEIVNVRSSEEPHYKNLDHAIDILQTNSYQFASIHLPPKGEINEHLIKHSLDRLFEDYYPNDATDRFILWMVENGLLINEAIPEENWDDPQNVIELAFDDKRPHLINALRQQVKTESEKKAFLRAAVKYGNFNSAKAFAEELKPLPKTIPDLLHLACISGNLDLVKELVHQGYDINGLDQDDETPLHYICSLRFSSLDQSKQSKLAEVVDFLLESHTDEIHKISENSPLYLASMFQNKVLIEKFLSHRVNPNLKDLRGHTPFMKLLVTPYEAGDPLQPTLECMQVLLDHHADINTQDNDKNTALHFLLSSLSSPKTKRKDPQAFQEAYALLSFCLQHGASLNLKNIHGETCLDQLLATAKDCLLDKKENQAMQLLLMAFSYAPFESVLKYALNSPPMIKLLTNDKASELKKLINEKGIKLDQLKLSQEQMLTLLPLLPPDAIHKTCKITMNAKNNKFPVFVEHLLALDKQGTVEFDSNNQYIIDQIQYAAPELSKFTFRAIVGALSDPKLRKIILNYFDAFTPSQQQVIFPLISSEEALEMIEKILTNRQESYLLAFATSEQKAYALSMIAYSDDLNEAKTQALEKKINAANKTLNSIQKALKKGGTKNAKTSFQLLQEGLKTEPQPAQLNISIQQLKKLRTNFLEGSVSQELESAIEKKIGGRIKQLQNLQTLLNETNKIKTKFDLKQVEIPAEYIDEISGEMMKEPVRIAVRLQDGGETYEIYDRDTLNRLLNTGLSPFTRQPFVGKLEPLPELKAKIEKFKKKNNYSE